MKKLIITADDFGIIPSINNAIIEAINRKKVNSVAAFSNYSGNKKYKGAVENAKILLKKTNEQVDIGVHFTITSGKPITGDAASSMCRKNGYFRKFNEFQRGIDEKALENELQAQYLRFKDNNIPVNHASSHHNAMTLFPELFKVYLKVAKDRKLAIRSIQPKPSNQYNKYLKVLSLLLMDGDLKRKDRKEMRGFFKKITDTFKIISKGKIRSTDYFDSRHYGPLPMIDIRQTEIKKYVEDKNATLKKMINELRKSPADSMEIVTHICKDKIVNFSKYKDLDYPGIAPGYFDSRIMEFLSILNFDFEQFDDVKLASWDQVKKPK